MKKRSLIGILCIVCVLLLNFTTVFAVEEEPTIEVKIPVSSNVETAEIILQGETHLPEITTIKGSGEFVLNFKNAEPGDVYTYTISQRLDNASYNVDEKVYTAKVYIFIEDDGLVYATTVIDDGNENKPIKCEFNNVPKENEPIPPSPATGDNSNIGLWIGMMCLSAILLGILTINMRKSFLHSKN